MTQSNVIRIDAAQWQASIQRSMTGAAKKNIGNAAHFIRSHPELAGAIYLDEFSLRIMLGKPVPWADDTPREWRDRDDTAASEFACTLSLDLTPTLIYPAVHMVAGENAHHPVRAYLSGLKWDGKPRVGDWLSAAFGCLSTPYTRAVGQCWLISAVVRVMKPACQADYVLILEGAQGIGKSSVLRALGGDWFTDELGDMRGKDAKETIQGKWIIELGELDSLSRSEVTHVKAFISRTVDRFRPAYGRASQDYKRQCVFAGTTNETGYLQDTTGNRRFWPVACEWADVEAVKRDRDQLWAEAVHQYRAGAQWWITDRAVLAEAEAEQEQRRAPDVLEERISEWVADRSAAFTMNDLLTGIGFDLAQAKRHDRPAGRILQALGYRKAQRRVDGRPRKVWER